MAYHRKVCRFCEKNIEKIDYKDVDQLERFLTDRGKILPRRATGTCGSTSAIGAGRSPVPAAGRRRSSCSGSAWRLNPSC